MLLHLSYQSPSEGGPASSGAHWLDAGLSGPQRQRGTMMSPSLAFVLHGSTLICSMVPLKNSMFSTPFWSQLLSRSRFSGIAQLRSASSRVSLAGHCHF